MNNMGNEPALLLERLGRCVLVGNAGAHAALRTVTVSASTSRRTYTCAYCGRELATESAKHAPTKRAEEAVASHPCRARARARLLATAYVLGLGEEATLALDTNGLRLIAERAQAELWEALKQAARTTSGSLAGGWGKQIITWAHEEKWPLRLVEERYVVPKPQPADAHP